MSVRQGYFSTNRSYRGQKPVHPMVVCNPNNCLYIVLYWKSTVLTLAVVGLKLLELIYLSHEKRRHSNYWFLIPCALDLLAWMVRDASTRR